MDHFIEEYTHLMGDPAHLAVELTFLLIFDLILIPVIMRIAFLIRDRRHGHTAKKGVTEL
jgi:hypothetical protein